MSNYKLRMFFEAYWLLDGNQITILMPKSTCGQFRETGKVEAKYV